MLRKLISLRSFIPYTRQFASIIQITSYSTSLQESIQIKPTQNFINVQHPPAYPKKKSAWRTSLDNAAAKGDVTRCLELLEEGCIKGNNDYISKTFGDILKSLPPRQALEVFNLAKRYKVQPTSRMAVSVIKMYEALGWLRHIEGAVQDMLAAGMQPHWSIFFHWANAHADAGLPEGVAAASKAAETAGLEVTSHYQTLMVKALCRSGNTPKTLELLEEYLDSGIIPPEPVWRVLIHCHGMAGHAQRAQAIFDEMREVGIVPGQSTWTALINSYAECYMPREAIDAMGEMQNAGVKGNTQTYTALLKACMHAADVAAAKSALAEMRKAGLQPTVHNWGAYITTCAMAGDVVSAQAGFDDMLESGCPAGVVQFTALLTAYRNAGDLHGGLRLLKQMDSLKVTPSRATFTEIMTLLGQHGMIREVEEAFAAMQAQGHLPDQIATNVLISALLSNWIDQGRHPDSDLLLRANEVFRDAWAAGVTKPKWHLSEDQKMVRVDLHYQGTWSAQLAALSILNEISFPGHEHDGLNTVMDGKKSVPALMFITGQGLKRGVAPVRDTLKMFLGNMGFSVRVAVSNGGTLIIPGWDVKRALRTGKKLTESFDVMRWHRALVDPRSIAHEKRKLN